MILRFLAFYMWKQKITKDKEGKDIEYKSDIDDFLGKTMIDLDFSILCSDTDTYIEYSGNIRKEFIEFSDKIYCQKRIEFLEKMVQKTQIFHHTEFFCFDQFKSNALQEIKLLTEKLQNLK